MASSWDVIIIGAGASGIFCGIQAAARGRRVLVLDHASRAGNKILISGGGHCNFTNRRVSHENFLSANPHFYKSALARYTPEDFIALVERHGIAYVEKDAGKLFCKGSSRAILELLLGELKQAGASLQTGTKILSVSRDGQGFSVKTDSKIYRCDSLVVATGGLSLPRLGASSFGLDLAVQMGHTLVSQSPGLVPFTLSPDKRELAAELAGVSLSVRVTSPARTVRDSLLFTHRGLSGPAILQLSNYWQPGETIRINLLPEHELPGLFETWARQQPARNVGSLLAGILPRRVIQRMVDQKIRDTRISSLGEKEMKDLSQSLSNWTLLPAGTEGYRTAEVMRGGVNCNELSQKTMESRLVPGLYFIGEVVDVTGQLGGYNFQWAWASGWSAGQVV